MTDKALVPIEQKQVEFYEDTITAVRLRDDRVFVPVRPIVEALGIDWNGQRRRINRDAVLSAKLATVDVTSTEGSRQVTRGVLCLPLDYVSGFLFGINASRVKEDLKEKVIQYQERCYQVLNEAFQEGQLTADPGFEELLNADSDAAQAYKMAVAIMKMARQQILLEARLDTYGSQLNEHENRLETIEGQLGASDSLVTPDQAMQLSQAVKTVAYELGKRSKRNEFGGVYGELYRRYGINSYKALPKSKFDDALAWLNDWLQSMISDTPF